MPAQNARERLLEICREQAARFGHAIELMRTGKMTTGGVRNGKIVDTTQETVGEYQVLKAELEATIARVEANNA